MENPPASNLPSVATILTQIESDDYPIEYSISVPPKSYTGNVDDIECQYWSVYVSKEQDLELAEVANPWSRSTELQNSSNGVTYVLLRVEQLDVKIKRWNWPANKVR